MNVPAVGDHVWLRRDPAHGSSPAEAVVVGYDGSDVFLVFVAASDAAHYHDGPPLHSVKYQFRTLAFSAMQSARTMEPVT